MNAKTLLELKSSAITLSDMEIFVFPELMYSLVLANIMSPCIWKWENDPWFKNIEKQNPYKRMLRIKQYIMDKYIFNLDLETWGLTSQQKEMKRFEQIIDINTLKKSNALFGYHGDTYYFDIGIRKHFGLDKYNEDIIPYWKTETVEAMTAFKYKNGYVTGAGECVSLAALYAAALFIIGKIPLENIYLMATPLHSQNFIDIRDGILTNNRRLVTKNMWSNGTEISAKARRAIENEQITIVSHISGYIHTFYEETSINTSLYSKFKEKLTSFVQTNLTPEVLGNFIRHRRDLHHCFQIKWSIHGNDYYLKAEILFSYELGSPHSFTSNNRHLLLNEIDVDDYHSCKLPKRIIINDLEDFVSKIKINLKDEKDIALLKTQFECSCLDASNAIDSLISFCFVTPKFPDKKEKLFVKKCKDILVSTEMNRETIIDYLKEARKENTTADLSFYAYRDLTQTEWEPFAYAALCRNPVSRTTAEKMARDKVLSYINKMPNDSIYPERGRLAQPDEVWNFKQGDGLEKAFLVANILRQEKDNLELIIKADNINLIINNNTFCFKSQKGLTDCRWNLTSSIAELINA